MKTNNKNQFQNPDLIFGNESRKQKSKIKNNILKSIMYCVAFIAILMACMVDSDSYIPYIVLMVCMVVLSVFMIANWDMIKKYEIRR